MKKKTVYHFLIIMLLISSLLMIAHNNAPRLLSMQFLWGPLFVIAVLFLDSKLFLRRIVFVNLFFFIVYGFLLPLILWTEMNDWYAFRQPIVFSLIFYGILLFSWLKRNVSLTKWEFYSRLSLVFIVCTCIMTIIATEINPSVVRIAYAASTAAHIDDFMFFRRLGFASYGYLTAIVSLFPPVIFLFKNSKNSPKLKLLSLGLLIILYFTILRSQVFANILVSSIIVIISFLGSEKIAQSIVVSLLLFIAVIIIPKEFWASLFTDIASFFNRDSNVYYKLNDMARFISLPEINDSNTGAGGRMERYPMLWEVFIGAPIWGDASYTSKYVNEIAAGGHLFWMSRLALWGVVGFVFFIYLLYENFKIVYKWLSIDFRFYYLMSVAAFVILGLMKSLNFGESVIVLFLVIPGLDNINRQVKSKS